MERQTQNISEIIWTNVSRAALLVTAVSLLTFAIGCFIINTHLSFYNLQDFDMVKPRAVYVGFTFCLILLANVGLYFFGTEIKTEKKALKEINTIKVAFFTPVIYYIFESDWVDNKASNIYWKGYEWSQWAWLFLIIAFFSWGSNLDKPIKSKRRRAVYFITITTGVVLFFIYGRNIEYILILVMQAVIGIVVYHFQVGTAAGKLKEERTISQNVTANDQILAQFDKSRRIDLIKEKYGVWVNAATYILLVFGFIMVVHAYTTTFYERLPQSLGGGKLQSIKYICGTDTVVGEKVYETSDKVFVLQKNMKIRKLAWSDIDEIVLKNK